MSALRRACAIFLLILVGCEGPEGAVGPQGEQGPQGEPAGNPVVIDHEFTVSDHISDVERVRQSDATYWFADFEAEIPIPQQGEAVLAFVRSNGRYTSIPTSWKREADNIIIRQYSYGSGELTVTGMVAGANQPPSDEMRTDIDIAVRIVVLSTDLGKRALDEVEVYVNSLP